MRDLIDIVETMDQEAWYMKGGCYQFALYLHEVTKLPLFGLADEQGAIHHAFVMDGDSAIDARGEMSVEHMMRYQGRQSAGTVVTPATVEEITEYAGGPLTDDEFEEADHYAREHDQLAQIIDR